MAVHVAALVILFASLANSQAGTQAPAFDAASVKTADKVFVPGVTLTMKGGPGTSDPGRITYTQEPLRELLKKAWGVEGYRIDGPAWINGTDLNWYNITATIPPGTTKEQFQTMLQNLLMVRFQIQLHHEIRDFPGYELVIAPGGSKLKEPASPEAPEPEQGPTGKAGHDGFLVLPTGHSKGVRMSGTEFYANFQNCRIAELFPYLPSFIHLATGTVTNHIVDKTGLTGIYDYSLKFDTHAPESAVVVSPLKDAASSGSSESEPSGLPNLFKAMEKQLGLRLVKIAKGVALDTIVIDHIAKVPTEN